MRRYTESELYSFISRADTHEKVETARKLITSLDYLDTDTYDDMMMALSFISRELYRGDRR